MAVKFPEVTDEPTRSKPQENQDEIDVIAANHPGVTGICISISKDMRLSSLKF